MSSSCEWYCENICVNKCSLSCHDLRNKNSSFFTSYTMANIVKSWDLDEEISTKIIEIMQGTYCDYIIKNRVFFTTSKFSAWLKSLSQIINKYIATMYCYKWSSRNFHKYCLNSKQSYHLKYVVIPKWCNHFIYPFLDKRYKTQLVSL